MNKLLYLSFLILISIPLHAQKSINDTIIEPIAIDKSILSGVNIPKVKLKAHPERDYYQKRIYKGSELSVYILSSETAVNKIDNFPIDEFVYYMNGKADIKAENGNEVSFSSGDYLFVPKGFKGNWTNHGGNTYNLELSVISNKRADSTAVSKAKLPFVLDKELISGIRLTQVNEKKYKDVIYSGVELEITTESEKPGKTTIINNKKEQFIHILNGMVTIKSLKGNEQTFYKGDFFILPKGYTGNWTSSGLGLMRTLIVMQK